MTSPNHALAVRAIRQRPEDRARGLLEGRRHDYMTKTLRTGATLVAEGMGIALLRRARAI